MVYYFGSGRSADVRATFRPSTLVRPCADLQLFVLGADQLRQRRGAYPMPVQVAGFAAPAVTIYAVVE